MGGAAARHALRLHADVAASLRLFVEKVGVAAAATHRWLELSTADGACLKAQLAGKWVVEYPTIHVATPQQALAFPLAASATPDTAPPENRWL